MGNQFLQGIPDADKLVVEKYVRDWDKGVTQQFQKRADDFKPYQELGSLDDIKQAMDVRNSIADNPVGFLNYYRDQIVANAEELGIDPEQYAWGLEQEMQEQEQEYEDLSPDQQEIADLKSQVEQLSTTVETDSKTRQDVEEQQMLDTVLEDLHNKHGDFDDTFVVSHLAQGKTVEQAIEAYTSMAQGIIDSRKAPTPPPIMSGEGGLPSDQVDTAKLTDSKYRKQTGAAFLKAANATRDR